MQDVTPARHRRPDSRRWILHGEDEPIFASLPQTVLANLAGSRSESPLVWNGFYPLAQQREPLGRILALRPLWGTPPTTAGAGSTGVDMYFWGYGLDGQPMPGLSDAMRAVDGPTGKTEVDLFIVGDGQLIAVEAKRRAAPGRCGRFTRNRCPEIHPAEDQLPCRYWEAGPSEFARWFDAGERPVPGSPQPPCSLHYQLFRTVVLGAYLAATLSLELGLWLVIPRANWPGLERTWLDFADRVRPESLWRRLRVIAWEDVLSLTHDRKD